MEQPTQSPVDSIFAELGTRLNEVEEKQRLVKDRILLIGQNLIETKEEFEKYDLETKKKFNELEADLKDLKQVTKRIINELDNFARKAELNILEKQAKIFQPLEFARVKDVKKMIEDSK